MVARYRALLIGNSTYPADEHNLQQLRGPIKDIAAVMAADPAAFTGYYGWEVYYVTTIGDVHLPVGYESTERIPAADYVAANPQTQ